MTFHWNECYVITRDEKKNIISDHMQRKKRQT